MMPSGVKRRIITQAAEMLKLLLRESHRGEILVEGEEDFGLVLFLTDKTKEGKLQALVVSLDDKAKVMRTFKLYSVDALLDQMKKKI